MGSLLHVSGTPYAGVAVSENQGSCCSSCAARTLAEQAGLLNPQPQGNAVVPSNSVAQAVPQVQQQEAPKGFSIATPARQAQYEHVTGNAYGGSERITGPVNMAGQLVSGTPEFRYQDSGNASMVQQPNLQQGVVQQAVLQQPAVHQNVQQAVQPQVVHAVQEVQPQMVNQAQPVEACYQTNPVQNESAVINQLENAQLIQAQQAHAQHLANQAYAQMQASTHRITGEGRQDGISITGDNWARGEQITGTEGRWSQGRNLTLRGEPRSMDRGAHFNKGLERPEVPPAYVTGSSGNSDKGATVTVSGGARG